MPQDGQDIQATNLATNTPKAPIETNNKEETIKMNKTLKKILLYFSILGAVIVAILGIGAIWGDIDEEVIGRTICTYIVLFLSILGISSAPKLYCTIKSYPELVSIGIWLLNISIAIISLILCVLIWNSSWSIDFVWKIIATIGMINFVMIVIVFSMDRWGPKSSE